MNNLLELTAAQEKRRRAIERNIKKQLKALVALAVEAGCKDPKLFYECEGSIHVFDESRGNSDAGSAVERQEKVAMCVTLIGRGTPLLDCGAW